MEKFFVKFPIYVNDTPQAVKSNLLLYADDSCHMYQHKNIAKIEKILNEDFENIWDWFVDNKLSIHYDKTKSNQFNLVLFFLLPFIAKRCAGDEVEINSYLGCVLNESTSGEPMALKVIQKKNGKLKLLYRKNKFLTPELH